MVAAAATTPPAAKSAYALQRAGSRACAVSPEAARRPQC